MSQQPLPCVLALRLTTVACSAGIDTESDRVALLRADRNWSKAASGDDFDALLAFWADDAVIYPAGAPAAIGKAAIREFLMKNREIPGFSISWEPTVLSSRPRTVGPPDSGSSRPGHATDLPERRAEHPLPAIPGTAPELPPDGSSAADGFLASWASQSLGPFSVCVVPAILG